MTPIGEYRNEYVCIFHLTSDHAKIEKIDEFVDTKYTTEFFERMSRGQGREIEE
jgi:hypothetical protein